MLGGSGCAGRAGLGVVGSSAVGVAVLSKPGSPQQAGRLRQDQGQKYEQESCEKCFFMHGASSGDKNQNTASIGLDQGQFIKYSFNNRDDGEPESVPFPDL